MTSPSSSRLISRNRFRNRGFAGYGKGNETEFVSFKAVPVSAVADPLISLASRPGSKKRFRPGSGLVLAACSVVGGSR